MKKFNIKMRNLISSNTDEYMVIRKTGGLQPDGSYEDDKIENIKVNILITTAKKEDYDLFNIGNTSVQIIKIRQMKDDLNLIQVNDSLTFNGFNFKVIKPKLYMNHMSDFNIHYAITEADAT